MLFRREGRQAGVGVGDAGSGLPCGGWCCVFVECRHGQRRQPAQLASNGCWRRRLVGEQPVEVFEIGVEAKFAIVPEREGNAGLALAGRQHRHEMLVAELVVIELLGDVLGFPAHAAAGIGRRLAFEALQILRRAYHQHPVGRFDPLAHPRAPAALGPVAEAVDDRLDAPGGELVRKRQYPGGMLVAFLCVADEYTGWAIPHVPGSWWRFLFCMIGFLAVTG